MDRLQQRNAELERRLGATDALLTAQRSLVSLLERERERGIIADFEYPEITGKIIEVHAYHQPGLYPGREVFDSLHDSVNELEDRLGVAILLLIAPPRARADASRA